MILFSCNAGSRIGFGHLVRCRALASAFYQQGTNCVMLGPADIYKQERDDQIFSEWLPRSEPWLGSEKEAEKIVNLVSTYAIKLVVLDDYRVDESFQIVLKHRNIKWLQFDGKASQPIWSDYVINSSPAFAENDYSAVLRNKNSHLFLGPKYAVLRPEFANIQFNKKKFTENQVLITFGAGDDRGAILFVLKNLVMRTDEKFNFLIVTGEHNPNINEIAAWIEKNGQERVKLLVNPDSMPEVYADCSMAIMAGGSSVYESLAFNLPMLLVSIAENQVRLAQAWQEEGEAVYLGALGSVSSGDLAAGFEALINLKHQNKNRPLRVDGLGSSRIAEYILNEL